MVIHDSSLILHILFSIWKCVFAFHLDGDSWLEGENNTSDYHTDNDRFNSGLGDRVYSGGRESPAKMQRSGQSEKPQRVFSSSTTDSFDYAFQRKGGKNEQKTTYDRTAEEDDFFDT